KRTLKREGVAGGVLAETFLLDLPLDAIAGHRVEAIDEENPVEVIELVLEDARTQAPRVDGHRPAVGVTGLDLDPHRARDRREDAWDREAPFFGRRLATPGSDDGIDESLGEARSLAPTPSGSRAVSDALPPRTVTIASRRNGG